jgi:hypothetical protein
MCITDYLARLSVDLVNEADLIKGLEQVLR